MKFLKKLLYLLTSKERKRAGLLIGMIIIMALLDAAGVASIMPFMAILSDPELIETNTILNSFFIASTKFGIENNEQFLFALGILVFLFLIISLCFRALTTYAQLRFIQMREHTISKRLIEGYLRQPYSWFLNRHSAELEKSVLSEVDFIVHKGFLPLITLISQSAVAIALLTLIILTDPKLALIIIFTLGTIYILIYKFTRGTLHRIGQQRLTANQLRFTAVIEAFGATKEIKVGGLENVYIKKFSDSSYIYNLHQISSKIISYMPRFALEAVTFGGMMLVILYLITQSGTFIKAVPIIALYAFAGYRLMPALQQIFASATQMRFVGPSLDAMYDDFKNLKPPNYRQDNNIIEFNKEITLNHVFFNYPNVKQTTLKNVHLNIPARTVVGFAGATGSGKTTIVDIILGLLETNQGNLKVDGQVINKNNSRAWQRSIGYVPQHIFLADDTVAANIAFGKDLRDIDQKAVERASKIANLHEFVINDLPLNYLTEIGERGIRLSGGQRQRIGIARALYHNPKVLILDEATSALDNLTEKEVMEAIHNTGKDITIILIAHRLGTLKECDKIFVLEKGELKNQGTYEELIQINENFRTVNTNI